MRRTIVGVMGSGSSPHPALARPLGKLVAEMGCHLLTGGGLGVMAEVSRAFCETPGWQGLAIGIVRSRDSPELDRASGRRTYRPAPVNPWIEVPIYTHLPQSSEAFESRNHVNVLTADVLVALPGSAGTLSEVRLRLQYGRPAVVFLGDPADGLTIAGRSARALRGEAPEPDLVLAAETLDDVERHLTAQRQPPSGSEPRA